MARKMTNKDAEEEAMMVSMMLEMPFFAMVYSSAGAFSEKRMNGLLDYLNGHRLKGIGKLIKG
jgi:hypothetical protein